jgi:hypothetical protein
MAIMSNFSFFGRLNCVLAVHADARGAVGRHHERIRSRKSPQSDRSTGDPPCFCPQDSSLAGKKLVKPEDFTSQPQIG